MTYNLNPSDSNALLDRYGKYAVVFSTMGQPQSVVAWAALHRAAITEYPSGIISPLNVTLACSFAETSFETENSLTIMLEFS